MANSGINLAKAYVQIIPSANGMGNMLTEELGGEVERSGSSTGERFASGFGKVAAVVGKAALAGITAAAAGVVALTKQAVESYADYEQLVGGMDTLFGDSSQRVQQYASEAYKTAGLSANEYMETVTNFSAALISSLDGDTKAAADAANTAIIDMADNANKMGTSMESIQDAYRGFAKQNYTMLDNLSLGYGGTKTEMERLLADAQELTGIEYDISNLNDVYEAIHVIQTEMGITGTTAKEASSTISGSISSLKASWENLLTGLADKDADLSQLIQNVVDSAKIAFGNLLPVIVQSLQGISQLVMEIAPMIVEEIPGFIDTVLPALLEAVTNLIGSVMAVLPDLLQVIAAQLPVFVSEMVSMLETNAPLLVEAAFIMVTTLANGIAESLPTLIPSIINIVLSVVQTILDNIGSLVDAAIAIITGLTTGILDALPILIDRVPEIIVSIVNVLVENLPKIILAAIEIINALTLGILDNLPVVIASILRLVADILQTLIDHLPEMMNSGMQIITTVADGLIQALPYLVSVIPDLIDALVAAFLDFDFAGLGNNIISGIASGIRGAGSTLISAMSSTAESALSSAKKKLGIHSPSTVFRDEVGKMLDLGMAEGITENEKSITDALNEISDMTSNALDSDLSVNITPTISQNINDIQNWTGADDIPNRFMQMEENIQKKLNEMGQSHSGDIVLPIYIGTELLDERIIKASEIQALRTGGR